MSRRFQLFVSSDHLILQPSDASLRALVVRRADGTPSESDDRHDRLLVSAQSYKGLLGTVDAGLGPHLVLLVETTTQPLWHGHVVHIVKGVEFVRVNNIPIQRPAEDLEREHRLLQELQSVLQSGSFYYSPTVDLTKSVQQRSVEAADGVARPAPVQTYFWNYAMARGYHGEHVQHWIVPIVLGAVNIRSIAHATSKDAARAIGKDTVVALFSRCGWISSDWSKHLTPPVEVEHVVFRNNELCSLVQHRGVNFRQLVAREQLTTESSHDALKRHFSELVEKHEAVQIVDLASKHALYSPLLQQLRNTFYCQEDHPPPPSVLKSINYPSTSQLSQGLVNRLHQFGCFIASTSKQGHEENGSHLNGSNGTHSGSGEISQVQRGIAHVSVENFSAPVSVYGHAVVAFATLGESTSYPPELWSLVVDVWREHIEGTIKFNRLWQATKVVEYMLNTLDPVSSAFGVQPSLSAVPKTATAESEADETTILAVAMGLLLAPRLGSAASYLTPTEYITSTEVVTTGESILGTWAVISINKRDEQQDRVILLSSAAFYRVKLKSRGRAVDHFTRIALEDIDHLQKGAFTGQKSMYGFRVFVNLYSNSTVHTTKPLEVQAKEHDMESVRTYAIQSGLYFDSDRKVLVSEVVLAIVKAHRSRMQDRLKVMEDPIPLRRNIFSFGARSPNTIRRMHSTATSRHSFNSTTGEVTIVTVK